MNQRARNVSARVILALGLTAQSVFGACDPWEWDDAGPQNGLVTLPVDPPSTIQPEPSLQDGPAYPITAFELKYVRENPGHPSLDVMMDLPITLSRIGQAYVMPREGMDEVTITLREAQTRGRELYYASAVQRILETLRDHLINQGLMGVYVAPDPLEITETGQDLREETDTTLTLVITTGIVTEMRTAASGERVRDKGPIKPEDRINNPVHQRILKNSPIQPFTEGDDPATRRDLMKKDELDRYLFFLSRHPGRRVDASVAAAEDVGGVALDYQVIENRPLTLYAQASNTGTSSTGYWRLRLGLMHTQLTNTDDVFTFDFITDFFDDTNAVLASYERPFPGNDRLRWRVHGQWNEFAADQLGFFDDEFTGEEWQAGADVYWNIYQQRELFVDLYGGARFQNIEVNNEVFLIEGEEDFIVPNVGVRMDRSTEWFSTQAYGQLEWWLSKADSAELETLGRTDPDEDATVFSGGLTHAVYLEPLINRKGWEDPTTPKDSTLAHELQFSVRGQYSFGDRLIPQAQQVAGGLYTVRGYPESVVAGDDVIISTIEYRWHLPRGFAIEPEPRQLFGGPFRMSPQYVYGRPDWDLVLKAFFDYGHVWNADRLDFEEDDTLMGAGVGLEFLFKRNINLRLDWGFALEGLRSGNVSEGSNRLHAVFTVLF